MQGERKETPFSPCLIGGADLRGKKNGVLFSPFCFSPNRRETKNQLLLLVSRAVSFHDHRLRVASSPSTSRTGSSSCDHVPPSPPGTSSPPCFLHPAREPAFAHPCREPAPSLASFSARSTACHCYLRHHCERLRPASYPLRSPLPAFAQHPTAFARPSLALSAAVSAAYRCCLCHHRERLRPASCCLRSALPAFTLHPATFACPCRELAPSLAPPAAVALAITVSTAAAAGEGC